MNSDPSKNLLNIFAYLTELYYVRIIITKLFSHYSLYSLHFRCSVFIMTVISLFPHGTTETEGEDDGQELDGNDNDHGSNDDVEIVLYQHDQLVVATGVHEGVL